MMNNETISRILTAVENIKEKVLMFEADFTNGEYLYLRDVEKWANEFLREFSKNFESQILVKS